MTAGYSGTPLAKKLSLKPGQRAWFCGMPESVRANVMRDAPPLDLLDLPEPPIDAARIFVTSRGVLDCELRLLLPLLSREGHIWVSWPKRASRLPSDVTEDIVRNIALPLNMVDVKVCAVDDTWSSLKLVIRKEHR